MLFCMAIFRSESSVSSRLGSLTLSDRMMSAYCHGHYMASNRLRAPGTSASPDSLVFLGFAALHLTRPCSCCIGLIMWLCFYSMLMILSSLPPARIFFATSLVASVLSFD